MDGCGTDRILARCSVTEPPTSVNGIHEYFTKNRRCIDQFRALTYTVKESLGVQIAMV